MLGEGGTHLSDLEELEAAARKFLARKEGDVDLEQYWALIVALKGELARLAGKADEIEESA
jgi:hypothetical protein